MQPGPGRTALLITVLLLFPLQILGIPRNKKYLVEIANTKEASNEKDYQMMGVSDCKCGLARRNSRIVGGEETEVNEYPWQVLIFSDKGYYCGGSLISNLWILTAAHCIIDEEIPTYRAVLGEHDFGNKAEAESIHVSIA
eukprot:TRINITY_DN17774_c0_g1_i1.p1 TRINITY_DN17774_c0_g1~~TRINITY_DN17774_c0_g1_i1.p1  ORF type:complete len:140 (+),score=19.74 TRINITY_DN17774_c0_g1_i1:255-674(+)